MYSARDNAYARRSMYNTVTVLSSVYQLSSKGLDIAAQRLDATSP